MYAYFNAQLGFDELLPGTPFDDAKHPPIIPALPYSITPLPGAKNDYFAASRQETRAEKEIRRQEVVRRRLRPSCFEEACAYGNLPAAIIAWAEGNFDIATRRVIYESSDATALMWASLRGHLSIVRFLLDQKAPVNAVNQIGHTALQWGIIGGHVEVVRQLLESGADPAQRDKQGFDASFVAVHRSDLPMLMMLTGEAVRDGVLRTSNDGLVFYGPNPIATAPAPQGKTYFLLDPKRRDVQGHTLLHWAAYNNSSATCQYLVEHWGFDVNAVDYQGRTPLIWSAREGFAECIEYLLGCGADRNHCDEDGWTALQYSRTRNHPEAAHVLSTYPLTQVLDHKGNSGASCDATAEVELSTKEEAMEALPLVQNRYISVRDRRAFGTWKMIRTYPTFALMAIFSLAYLLSAYIITGLMPPLFSHFIIGGYFFKNVVWMSLAGVAEQSRVAGPPLPYTRKIGIAVTVAESVRGIWLYRLRDPSNLFVVCGLLFTQVYAWNSLGFSPLFHSSATSSVLDQRQWLPNVSKNSSWTPPPVHSLFGLSLFRLTTLQPLLFTSAATDPAVRMEEEAQWVVRTTLCSLLVLLLICMVLCKTLASRSFMRKSEEGTMRSSPLWRIIAARDYRWLHPRFLFLERHMQLPLRAFYCQELDVVVRGYDSYSAWLDCAIGAANHVFFVLALTFLSLLQFLLFTWGIQQAQSALQCPAQTPWYAGGFYAFQDVATLQASLNQTAAVPVASDAPPVASIAWLHTAMELFLHGLPCRQYSHLQGLTTAYVTSATTTTSTSGALAALRRGLFLASYYILPTRANLLGVWAFHFTFAACIAATVVAVRQWRGVWLAATQVELVNPIAQGADGSLVALFPPDATRSTPCPLISPEEERYFAAAFPAKARAIALPRAGPRCIYAAGNGLVNCLVFLCGQSGLRWRRAMAVSSSNAPVQTPMLT